MKSGLIIITILLLMLALTAYAAQPTRVSLGLLPFEGKNSGLTYAVPGFISWELYFIPRIDQTSMRGICWSMQIDRLTCPHDQGDTAAYSALAGKLGVDYLIAGAVERLEGSKAHIKINIYSSSDAAKRTQLTFDIDTESIPSAATRIAREIAVALNIPVGRSIRFDESEVTTEAVRVFDDALRVLCDSDTDISCINKVVHKVDNEIRNKNNKNHALWTSTSYYFWRSKYINELENTYAGCRGNTLLLSNIMDVYFMNGEGNKAINYASEWKRLDPASPLAQFTFAAASGWKPGGLPKNWQPNISVPQNRAWRPRIALIDSYSLALRIDEAKAMMLDIESHNPRSAYILTADGRILSRRGRWPECIEKYKAAIALNPKSFRLKMFLAEAYYEDSKDDEAWNVLCGILKTWPKKTEGHRLAARMYLKRGDMRKAVEQMRLVEKLDPNGDFDRRIIAREYMRSGRFVEAARELAKSDPRIKGYMIGFSLVLTVIFLIAVIIIALIVRVVLAPDGKRSKLGRKTIDGI